MTDARDSGLVGFGFANYRSFDDEGYVVENIQKINVFIGKNNSGKSNILRTIRLLKRIKSPRMPQGETSGHQEGLDLKLEVDSHNKSDKPPSATAVLSLGSIVASNERLLNHLSEQLGQNLPIQWNTRNGTVRESKDLDALGDDDLLRLHDLLTGSRYEGGRPRHKQLVGDLMNLLLNRAVAALRAFDRLICVEDFREIRTVSDAESNGDTFNGYNVIKRLRNMQHPRIGKENERAIFNRIEGFVGVLLDEPDVSMEIPAAEEAIYVSMHGRRLPLESYGTGLHQLVILCAALAMHDGYYVCIEEPEIHMHPELQRKFLRFIADKTANRYFITTHSNVFLDFVPDVAIYHVTHNGMRSTVTRVEASSRARDVLADLGYKASDLLQANCVIWVEGPSDRVYLNKWLSLADPDLVEGIHYAITFYGGKVLAHFAAVDHPTDDLVEVLRINQHAIFIMDRDDANPGGKLNPTKERISEEIGQDQCWVTQGREIENYLRPALLEQYLSGKCGQAVTVVFKRNQRVENAIATATKAVDGPKVDYAKAKVCYARQFCALMDKADLQVLDLNDRLTHLVQLIHQWNHMSVGDNKQVAKRIEEPGRAGQ